MFILFPPHPRNMCHIKRCALSFYEGAFLSGRNNMIAPVPWWLWPVPVWLLRTCAWPGQPSGSLTFTVRQVTQPKTFLQPKDEEVYWTHSSAYATCLHLVHDQNWLDIWWDKGCSYCVLWAKCFEWFKSVPLDGEILEWQDADSLEDPEPTSTALRALSPKTDVQHCHALLLPQDCLQLQCPEFCAKIFSSENVVPSMFHIFWHKLRWQGAWLFVTFGHAWDKESHVFSKLQWQWTNLGFTPMIQRQKSSQGSGWGAWRHALRNQGVQLEQPKWCWCHFWCQRTHLQRICQKTCFPPDLHQIQHRLPKQKRSQGAGQGKNVHSHG